MVMYWQCEICLALYKTEAECLECESKGRVVPSLKEGDEVIVDAGLEANGDMDWVMDDGRWLFVVEEVYAPLSHTAVVIRLRTEARAGYHVFVTEEPEKYERQR